MKKVKFRSKKILSVFLSMLMIMSCVSVCFPAFAADAVDYDTAIAELAEALKSDTVKNFTSYTAGTHTSPVYSSTESGKNMQKTYTTTFNAKDYAQYSEVINILQKIDAVIKSSVTYRATNPFSDGDTKSCLEFGDLSALIEKDLIQSGKITAAEMSEYQTATLFSILFRANDSVSHNGKTSSDSSVCARIYNVLNVKTTDYQGYLAGLNSRYEVAGKIDMASSYRVGESREQYKVGSGCNEKTFYHHAITAAHPEDIALTAGTETNTEVKQKIDEYESYLASVDFDKTYEEMLDMVLNNTMKAFYNEFKEKNDAIVDYVGGLATFNKLFSDYSEKIDQMFKSCESATDVETYLKIAEQWKAFTDAHPNYGVYSYGAYEPMIAAYNDFMQIYSQLEAGGDELLGYLNKHGNISLDYYNNFTDNIKVYELAATAEKAAALYGENKDTYEKLTTEEKQAVYSLLNSYINSIGNYSEQVVNTIYPNGYAELLDLQEKLYCAVNEYVVYFAALANASFVDMSTADIEKAISEIPAKTDGLNAFYAELSAASGEARAEELLGDIVAVSAAMTDTLYKTLAARFTSEVNYAYELYISLGEPTELTLHSYTKLNTAFKNLEDEILTYLTDSGNSELVSEQTTERYDYLRNKVLDSYNDFKATFGLSNYSKTTLTYSARDVYPNDKIKTDKYEVAEQALLSTVSKLDSFLTGEKFADLTGVNLEETLTGVLDNIYSDSLVNTVIKYLYPLIADEFIKVWAGIDPVMKQPGSSLNDQLNDSEVTITLNLDDVETATANMGLYLFPNSLADHLKKEYPNGEYDAAADVLASSIMNRWSDSAIADENGELNLVWGVTDKESFVNAVDAALSGLEPLLLALLSNKTMDPGQVVIGNATASGAKSAKPIDGIAVNLTINAVKLALSASGNAGYNNALAPVFEALGVSAPNGNEFNSVADFVEKGLLEPVEALLSKVAAAPVDEVLSILPNLLYALSTEMVVPILGMLKTNIAYSADADYAYSAIGLVNGSGTAPGVLKDSIDINVGNMIDLKSMGIDLSNGLQGILDLIGIELPEIDAATVATLGSLKEIDTVRSDYIYDNSVLGVADGKALTIEADKADAAYYILTYVVDFIQDEAAFKALLSKFVKDEAKVDSIASTIASLGIKSTGDVVAALVELLNTEKYPQKTFEYPEFVEYVNDTLANIDRTKLNDEERKMLEEYEATHGKSVVYSRYWTKNQAKYVSDNLIPFATKLAGLLGYDLSEVVTDLVSNLYTKENLVKLVDLLNGLLAKADEDETVKSVIEILDPLVNIDVIATLNALKGYAVPDFEDGDRDAFVNALVDYIKPVVPVLKLLLVDSADNSELVIADVIELYGYNGYDNALIPVLEAIGCKPADITKYADFIKLDDEAMVRAVLNPILALVDSISADPINGILGLLPNILYFIDFGGLEMAVNNLLEPVYAVLDVIRPIYNVDFTINLNLAQVIDDLLVNVGIKSIGYSDISSIVKSLGKSTEYTSANGRKATYITVEESLTPEFITVLLRTVIRTLVFSDGVDKLVEYLSANNEGLTEAQIANISKTLHSLAKISDPDKIMYVLYYIFFGLNTGVTAIDKDVQIANKEIVAVFEALDSTLDEETKANIRQFLQAVSDKINSGEGNDDPATCNHICHKAGIMGWFYRILRIFWRLIGINKTCSCGVEHY